MELERHSSATEIFAGDGQHLVGHIKRRHDVMVWVVG
jgi:hypothetical protein